VRIDQVGRTAASALLLDESGEVVSPPARTSGSRAGSGRGRRRAPASLPSGDGDGAGGRESRSRRRRAPVDSEDLEARREAGLGEPPAGIDSEPEEELATDALTSDAVALEQTPADGTDEDGLQSKPRRRGRRGGRRRSAAKAKAAPE